MPNEVLVIGHRGASVSAPENTLAAFALAMAVGADAMECDVRATIDRVPIILHDATVDRTSTGSGDVASMTLAELQAFDASSGREAYRGERVPTLEQLLGLVAGRAFMVLEFKSMDSVEPSAPIVRTAGAARWSTAWSFRPEILAELRRHLPELSRSLLIGTGDDWDGRLATAIELGCIAVSLRQDLVDGDRVASAKARGLSFFTWTADAPDDWRRLVDAGVDGIVTNDPKGLREYLDTGAGSRS
jgi:glycerophosphoryl diester phosphodiesterase